MMTPDIAAPASPRERLRKLLRRVPAGVIAGSHQDAVAFKKWAADALKKVNAPRTKEQELEGLVAAYLRMDKKG